MVDLEIADYERTVQALTEQLQEKDKTIRGLEEEQRRVEQKNSSLAQQLGECYSSS